MAQQNGHAPDYDLYYNPFSICSLMVLYTLRLKGQPRSPADAVDPEEKLIDIYTGEQMSENYLENIHPLGTVPALLSPSAHVKLTDSTTITSHLMEHYPSLRPTAHAKEIDSLLEELHEISYVTLSFKPEERRIEALIEAMEGMMASEQTSEKYRGLLKVKYDSVQSRVKTFADNKQSVDTVEGDSKSYLSKISALLSKQSGPSQWLFGDNVGPTALDAHTVVFIARLLDAKRPYLIPGDVLEYGKRLLSGEKWLGITGGHATLHSMFERGEGRAH